MPTSAPMYRTERTWARPPQMVRCPRSVPLSRFRGATPTSAAICLRFSLPSSGNSARRVVATTRPTPGYAAQQVVFLAPDRAFANRCGQVIVDLLEPLPKPLHVLADTTAEIRRRRALPVLLRDEHLDELPAPRDESGESLSLLVGQHPGFRVHGLCEMRQHRRVERISLGEPSRGLGKVAHLPGIDDCDWHMCKRQRSSNGDLESARCFDDDQFDSVLGQALE